MSSLHPARLVDEGTGVAATATTQTPAPARGTSRHRAGNVAETIASTVPSQRLGTASPTGTTSVSTDVPAAASAKRPARAAGRPAAKSGPKHAAPKRPAAKAAAGSLAAKARAATAAAGRATTAAKAAAKPATKRAAASKDAKASTVEPVAAQPAAAAQAKPASAANPATKATTAAKPATKSAATAKAATKSAAKPAAKAATAATKAKPAAAKRTAKPAVAAPEVAAAAPARPTPYARAASDVPETRAGDAVVDTPAPVVVAAVGELQTDPAEVVPALAEGRRSWLTGRRAAERRRPAFYLAAGLIGAISMGMLVDTDPAALAETSSVSTPVSVAEQLGIEEQPTETLQDPESTRGLQELVASRRERDAAQMAAADAQAAADRFAWAAAIEAARPKAVAPVNGARLTSGFGARWGTQHAGLDLAAPMRTPEYAVMDGVVLEAGPASGFGLAVYIQHDNGDVTVYGHMDEILVEPGQVVRAGDTIALVGNRGQSTGPHLHFEVHSGGLNGPKVDPMAWLRERGVTM